MMELIRCVRTASYINRSCLHSVQAWERAMTWWQWVSETKTDKWNGFIPLWHVKVSSMKKANWSLWKGEIQEISRTKHIHMDICTLSICHFLSCKKSWKNKNKRHVISITVDTKLTVGRYIFIFWLFFIRVSLCFWLTIQKLASAEKFLIPRELFLWHLTFAASINKLLNDSLIPFLCPHKPQALRSSCPSKSDNLQRPNLHVKFRWCCLFQGLLQQRSNAVAISMSLN